MAAHSNIPAWRILWTSSLVAYIQSIGLQRIGHDWGTKTIFKALNLKGITLSHSYRDNKWQNRQNLLSCQGLKGTLWPDLHRQLQEQRIPELKDFRSGGDISIAMADPCWCMAETNNIVVVLKLKINKLRGKKACNRTSLVVQWLGICLPMWGTMARSRARKIPYASVQLIPWATSPCA